MGDKIGGNESQAEINFRQLKLIINIPIFLFQCAIAFVLLATVELVYLFKQD